MKKRKILFLTLIFSGVLFCADAQTKTSKREVNKLTDHAEEEFYNENYRAALALYQQLFQLNPDGADYYNYQIALCYLYSNIDNEKAMSYIDMAKESMAQTPVSDFYYYNLAKSYHLNNKYEDALIAYQQALDAGVADKQLGKEIELQMQICRNAIEITKKPLDVLIKNLEEPVNTQFAEYRPLISADESILIFTSRREGASSGKADIDGKYYEDIYITEKDELGYWKSPEKISANINTELHEASVGLSADGRELLIYKGNPNAGGLFMSRQVGTEWSVPQVLGENVNSKKYNEPSASISADGKYIYFVSNRKGGIGERDIWKGEKNSAGDWGKAENIGAGINTIYDEESPFIHPDGKTLYFSSKGHNSIGGYDIFKSVFENGNWSKPENIGYPINTPGDDVHFVLSADGTKGYFTSSRTGTLGEQDIYKVDFDATVPLILVKGIVKKEEPGEFKVSISVIDKATNEPEEFVYNPNPSTGKYLLILPPGKNYDLLVEAETYTPYIVNINIPNQKIFHELYQEIILRKINGVQQEVTVTNYFDDIRQAKKEMDSPVADIGKVASPEYLQNEMKKLVAASKQGKNSESAQREIEKINSLTDKVTDNFDLILDAKIPTEVLTTTISEKQEQKLELVKIGNQTVYAVPSSSFVKADVARVAENREQVTQNNELAQLKADLAKAKSQPKSGNYITDLANERYMENLEEEIAAIEGGYALVPKKKKEKPTEYAVEIKKESGIFGTQTKAILDKEKELAEREAAIAKKEAEQNELAQEIEKTKESGTIEKIEQKSTDSGNEKDLDFSAKEKELQTREREIAKIEKELATKEAELAKKEAELVAREAALNVKKTEKKITDETTISSETETTLLPEKVSGGLTVYFEYNKSDLQKHYENDLNEIAKQLKENSSFRADISGHTDSKGTDDYNNFLSKRRAESVMKYLISKGIDRNKISVKYFGESQPLTPNANPDGTDNPEGRDKNRRAEIKVR